MFRRPLMVLLSLGVVFGYGGAFASFRHHAYAHECNGGGGRWGDHRWERWEQRSERAPAAVAPVIVQAAAPAPVSAPAVTPQVFIIMPGGAQNVPAAVIPAANMAPASAAP